jgi:tRNA(His) 5'-end guanylyltransferase
MARLIKDVVGDRCKDMEQRESQTLLHGIPVIARIDGRAFHTFARGLERPFSDRFRNLMIQTTCDLVEESGAVVGYTQSDEITLAWNAVGDTQMWFGGKVQKIVSHLAAIASVSFNRNLPQYLPEKASVKPWPTFDARVWSVPSLSDVVENLAWREADAVRNSVSAVAQSLYSHKDLHGANTAKQHDLIHAKGLNWNDFDDAHKRGAYVKRVQESHVISSEEIAKLPERHELRKQYESGKVTSAMYSRSVVKRVAVPPITKINPYKILLGVDDGEES